MKVSDEKKQVNCECDDWAVNIEVLNMGVIMNHIHGGNGYTGKIFKYCPWCGKELK